MTAAADAIASYVPDLLHRRLADHPERVATPHADHMVGALLLADIAGFTAITEQLARQGPGGAEALSGLLNGAFGPLLARIAEAGGDVLKFAGDALLVCWPVIGDDSAAGLALATRRAARCAQVMQATLQGYAAAEGIELSLRVGVGAGEVVLLDVGGALDRRELLVAGEAVPQTTAAARDAQPGQVVAAPEAWALLEEVCVGERVAGGVRVLSAPPVPPVEAGSRRPVPDGAEAVLLPYLPRALLGSLRAGHDEWLAELRRVTLLFVNLPGLDHSATLERAQRAMHALQTALYRYEGSINKLSLDDKGTMLVAALGLPPLAHEDDPARAVQAALAMRAALAGLGERAAIGITTGRVFCGVVGNRRRREYTVLGAVVNLAARLMQAAPGGILCDAATARAAGAAVVFEELPAVKVKGHTDPVAVYRPRDGAVARPGPAWRYPVGPLVGRTAERERLAEQLRMLVQTGNGDSSQASVVVLEGEAGIGKSRLVGELVEQARAAGVGVLAGAGDAIERNTPFHAWREIFARLPAIDAAGDTEGRRRAVLDLLGPDPETRELAPLLNAVLPLEWPETARTAELSPQGRADHTRSLLVRLLQAAIGGTPTVLVLEDAHWFDSASSALASAVCRNLTPALLVLATRPPDEQGALVDDLGWAAYRRLLQAPGTTRLILDALSPEDVEALVCRRLGVTAVPEVVASFVHDKAEGSPLFSEELAYALRDAKLIRFVGGRCQLAPGVGDISVHFPDTVHGVITSRIDRLTPNQQLTLKVASVIGRVFALRVLRDIYPVKETAGTVVDDLVALEGANLTVLDSPEPHLAYLFKHVITQEAAYNLMLAAQRRQLHRTIAEWYEHTHAGDLLSHAPLLAYHWQGADVPDKAIVYLEEAGGQALRTGAYREAVRVFSRLLDLHDRTRQAGEPELRGDPWSTARRRPPEAPNIRRARWEHQLGDAYHGLGQLRPAREHLHAALALLNRRMPASGRRLAVRLSWQVLQQARNRLWPPSAAARSPEARGALLEAADVYERLYVLDLYANRRTRVIHEAVKGLNLAEAAGSVGAVARLTVACGVSLGFLARHRLAEAYIKRSLTVADKAADPFVRAWVLQFAALHGVGMGRWAAATEQLDEAAEIMQRVGDRRRLGEIKALRGCVAYFQGDLAGAASLFAELRRYGSQHRNTQIQAWALLAEATHAVRSGDLDQAMLVLGDRRAPALEALLHLRHDEWQAASKALQAALEPVRAAPIKCYWHELYATTAEAAIALWHASRQRDIGDQPTVRAAAEQAMQALRRYAKVFPIGQPRALLCQGLLAWVDERPMRARRAWRRSLAMAERLGMRYDQMLAHHQLGRHGDPSERDQHLARARQLFAQLGIAGEVAGPETLAAHLP